MTDYSRAIEINPQNADVYIFRGNLYKDREEINLALTDYSRAIEINPQNTDAYITRGILYAMRGETKLALADLQKAQQLFITQDNAAGAELVADILKKLE